MRKRIFIVDDEPHNIHILRVFLTSLNYDIYVAENGRQAVEMIDAVAPDLILLDVMMPDLSGFEVFKRWLDKDDFDVPIIFLSANVQKKAMLEGLQLGAFDYLTKPYDLDLLEMKVSIALQQKMKLSNLKKDNEQLAELAYVDALTGLYNRTYLEVVAQQINDGYKHYESVLMIDMDNFKTINDTFGHMIGDQTLRDIGNILFQVLSPYVHVTFRYGGDEFLVILQDSGVALAAAEAIIAAVDQMQVGHPSQKQIQVSVSIGVSHSLDCNTLHQMISQADSALLGSKRGGRHQITVK
ncbi:diguanylate cyclase (GGDEF) domain-containing protein [Paenibacillus algorifonticola]|uniref:Diguanylate cyclase (GGDEF) domain-containing protein n=1 Tax=Paenibacillus algorifonticola TaxID=684063 RepID=A0A1I1Z380_9BACL|nr:diguanylate cyclase [Paenibacillus algorifonticola]SFE26225.1 diguanylate cyclase (GGDEF) domain-containing protein [Paenibacillus algorifonticola]